MNNFKKNNRFSGEGFKPRGGRDFGQNKEMHQAICADCGKTCEVPFRPNGKKPVYCKDCFGKNGGQVSTNDFSKKSFAPSHAPAYAAKPQNNDRSSDELAKQLGVLNAKFDKLVSLAETLISKMTVPAVQNNTPHIVESQSAEKTEKTKMVVKKVPAKKK